MTTPSPQPQPNDWAMKAAEKLMARAGMHRSDEDVSESAFDTVLQKWADIIRSFAPAPAPTANEGAVNELVEACEPFVQALNCEKSVRALDDSYLVWKYTITRSEKITLGDLRRLAKAVAAVKGGSS
jgi:hypothetical protein